jgi:hypothetical protein
MRTLSIWLCVLCLCVTAVIGAACSSSNNPTSAAPTPTPTPNYITFQITNSSGFVIDGVALVREATGKTYSATCNISSGPMVSVNVVIPASDTYTPYLDVQSSSGWNYYWSPMSFALGSVNIVTIPSTPPPSDPYPLAILNSVQGLLATP